MPIINSLYGVVQKRRPDLYLSLIKTLFQIDPHNIDQNDTMSSPIVN